LKVLGRGYYGRVELWQRKNTEELYAVKICAKSRLVEGNAVGTIFSERSVLLNAHHPYVVSFYFAFQTKHNFHLGLEYVSGGNLRKRVMTVGGLPASDMKFYAAEIALALNYLHKLHIMYRDLKTENVMLDGDGHAKLLDFGLAKHFENDDGRTDTFCGTAEYLAPEIVMGEEYGMEIDWWGLGILMYEMLFARTPFGHANQATVFAKITGEEAPFSPRDDPAVVSVIQGLLAKSPDERFGFKELTQHEFFHGINFVALERMEIAPPYKPPPPNLTEADEEEENDEDQAALKTVGKFVGFSVMGQDPVQRNVSQFDISSALGGS
jgi:serine/threonine protein kinase